MTDTKVPVLVTGAESTRILIVDDEPETRDLIAEYLGQHGYDVLQAGNGLEALLQVKHMRPDGVILDLHMPRLGGLEALKRIHAFDAAIVIVITTGHASPEIRQRALDLGAIAVLDKPFSLPTLLATLQTTRATPPLAADASASRVEPSAPPAAQPAAEQSSAPRAEQSSAPRAEQSSAPRAEQGSAPPRAGQSPAPSVLVVDDDPDIRAILEEFLSVKGYAVRTASDGAGAIREIAHAPADVILLDIEMPGLRGVDALPTLHALAPRAAIIMVSGSTDVELSRRALAHGAFDYVIKPVDFEYLTRSLETALAMKDV